MKVVLSAFACDPSKGSEPHNGWCWASGLAERGYEVHCLTRDDGKASIEQQKTVPNLHFHYVVLPLGLEKMYAASTASMYLYYLLWQWLSYRRAKKLHRTQQFSLAHHVTWGSLQMGSFLYKLNIPFIFGPVGGGQKAPEKFKKYFLNHWATEEKREKISDFMGKYSPACKKMLGKADVVIVTNNETLEMARSIGAKKISFCLDFALPESFFPAVFTPKQPEPNRLQLLWVGRFLPRKGILLILDVMMELKDYSGITLTVVGDGEMRSAFLDTITKYSLEQTVDWKGSVPFVEVKKFYATHDVFFFTSLRDSSPAQLVEAMAYGMPVVTLNLHGQAMNINDQTGIRCACDTPEMAISELKKAILFLYNNQQTVTSMSTAAHAYALQQTWTNKINHIVHEYYPAE
ncbi:MAG: glycosyltransferase family 4 protein [Chitinophagaceae bacterium]